MKLRFVRKLQVIALAIISCMCFTGMCYAEENVDNTAILEASSGARAGVETLYAGSGSIGSFYLQNNNLTPVKTMGASGTFSLFGTASCSSTNYWQICVQIKDAYTGTVLATDYTTGSSYNFQYYSMELNVTKGQKIQIFTYYTSTPSTEAKINLTYTLE